LEVNQLGEPGKVTGVIKDITEQKIIEQEIQKSNNIINRSNSVAFRWLNDGKWTVDFVTDNIVDLCGYKPEDFYNKIVIYKDIVHSNDLERVRVEFKKYNELEHDQGFQHSYYRIVSRNGEVKWISDNTFVSRGSNGQITHYDGIVTDVTDIVVAKEAIEESEKRFRSYTENAPDGIFVVNEQGFYQDVNPEACMQTGYSKEELLGMHISQMVPKEELEYDQDKFLELTKNNFMKTKTKHITKDGTIKYWKLSAVKIAENRFMGFTQDITEIKKKENELKIFKENLEQLVKDRTKELEEKNAKLEKFNKLFVDREFRVKELKDRIKELESK
jgi:PAS domain S-box-containing protein